jgi:uncharacterized protein YecT (DUF1311 family)
MRLSYFRRTNVVKSQVSFFAAIFLIFCAENVLASSVCDGSVNSQLASCEEGNFKASNLKLNNVYKDVIAKIPQANKPDLTQAQRNWIKYKDEYCQSAYDSTSPGQEASIDKWNCLDEVTSARTRELSYLISNESFVDFSHALKFMADTYEGGDQSKVIKKLISDTPGANDKDWSAYVDTSCKVTASILQEDRNRCEARLNFYKIW